MSPKSYWISEKESVSWTLFFLTEYRERREREYRKENIERKRKERRKEGKKEDRVKNREGGGKREIEKFLKPIINL